MDHQFRLSTSVSSMEEQRNMGFQDELLDGPNRSPSHEQGEAAQRTPRNNDIPAGNADSHPSNPLAATATNSTSNSPIDNTSLPRLLQLLFGLNGLSLSLLTLPIMYILNTRVEVPLPYLPAYGAIAFLPYSLKPMYAYLCGLLATSCDGTNIRYHNRYLRLFGALLTCNSLCTALYTLIPKGGVLAIFVVAFLRGFLDSWAEFCLGLTLIDRARYQARQERSYDSIVSKLQAQAATAGNLGAWLASSVTCLLFLERYIAARNSDGEQVQQQLSGGVANGLILLTASIQLLAAVTVYLYDKGSLSSFPLFQFDTRDNRIYQEVPTATTHDNSNSIGLDSDRLIRATESDSLRDEESSHPSYSSLEDLADDEDSTNSSISDNSTASNRLRLSPHHRSSRTKVFYGILVVLLQSVLIMIGLKGPFVEWSSHFVWGVCVTTLVTGIGLTLLALCCGNHAGGNSQTLRVGLYLVLRNAVPSDTMIVASFFYTLFGESQPIILQLLSFLGLGVSSFSSWTYTNLFSTKFSVGRPLLCIMAGTIVLASMASLLNIAVFREYQRTGVDSDTDDAPSTTSIKLLAMAALAKFVTVFFEEWAFLPELVLATTSVKTSATATTTDDDNEITDDDHSEGVELCPLPASEIPVSGEDQEDNAYPLNASDNDKRIAMEYGTLISCIDFGDQLGSLTAAPLVAILRISRDNNFLHLDRLILICALANMVVTIGLLPLIVGQSRK